jgi:hypothetical protein
VLSEALEGRNKEWGVGVEAVVIRNGAVGHVARVLVIIIRK